MQKKASRARSGQNESWSSGMMDMARDRPVAAAAVAAGAAAAGLFLWSKRNQVTKQLNQLSDQIGNWTENMTTGVGGSSAVDDNAGPTTSKGARPNAQSSSAQNARRSGAQSARKTNGSASTNAKPGLQSGRKPRANASPNSTAETPSLSPG